MRNMTFGLIGGDRRQYYLEKLLRDDGQKLFVYGRELCPYMEYADSPECISDCDCVILPVPAESENGYVNLSMSNMRLRTEDIFAYMRPGSMLAAGKVTQNMYRLAESRGILLVDYLDREDFAIMNAVATVEGGIALAIDKTPYTLHGSEILVAGYGRIGRILADRIRAFGGNVSVSARKYSDLAWIKTAGCKPVEMKNFVAAAANADLIFNTVPAQILTKQILLQLKPGVLIIDLASLPGGVEDKAAEELGIEVMHALSLPGKTAPMTSGRIIRDTVYNIIHSNKK